MHKVEKNGMRIYTLNIFLILIAVQTFSQDKFSFDWNGKDFIESLKSKEVDSIYSVKLYRPGVEILSVNENDSVCKHEDWRYFDLYVFWKSKGEKFVKKFNNCFEFEITQLDSLHFIKYYGNNRKTIENEKIESATGFEVENGDTTFIILDVDHYCKMDLIFDIKDKIYQKAIYDYDFDTRINQYYGEQNRQLKTYTLYNQINSEIDLIERQKNPRISKNE